MTSTGASRAAVVGLMLAVVGAAAPVRSQSTTSDPDDHSKMHHDAKTPGMPEMPGMNRSHHQNAKSVAPAKRQAGRIKPRVNRSNHGAHSKTSTMTEAHEGMP
jgi:hypothetical protein